MLPCDKVVTMLEQLDLRTLTIEQRRALAARLAELDGGPQRLHVSAQRRRFGLAFYGASSVVMLVWIVTLMVTLPNRYEARSWRTSWVGFDLMLLALLATLGWAAWRRRHLILPTMIATGTLLLCDAWFDVSLSWNGKEGGASLVTAVVAEVPLAILLFARARTIILVMATAFAHAVGIPDVPRALYRLPLYVDESAGQS